MKRLALAILVSFVSITVHAALGDHVESIEQDRQQLKAARKASHNGVMLVLPSIAASGAGTATGSLVLGIGTQSNNTPSGTTTFAANSSGNFKTSYNSHTYDAFIDSGSNANYFPSTLTQCTGSYAGFYCPTSTTAVTATQMGTSGSPSSAITFNVANTVTLINSNNNVFSNLAGSAPSGASGYFDWGLPFFFGRSVYIGLEGTSSPAGTGPYWAY